MVYRDMPEIPGHGIYRQGSGNQFRRPGASHQAFGWVAHPLDASVDPRLTAEGDHPQGIIPPYVPAGRIDPRNVFSIRPA